MNIKKIMAAQGDEVSSSYAQQYHLSPGVIISGKRQYTADESKQFLTAMATIGFGSIQSTKTKKILFKKEKLENLESDLKEALS
jgi:hypothetical protein